MDLAITRKQNDELLLSRLGEIRSGQALDVLEPFAKAYLGLFYDIDNQIPPRERLDLLANSEIAHAVEQGFIAALSAMPSISATKFVVAMQTDEPMGEGYIALAGMDRLNYGDGVEPEQLPNSSVKTAIWAHYANNTFHEDSWLAGIYQRRPELAAEALLELWHACIERDVLLLPGFSDVYKGDPYQEIIRNTAIPLLSIWKTLRATDLARIFRAALNFCDHSKLSDSVNAALPHLQQYSIRHQVYWVSTAFLLNPDAKGQNFIQFMGQEKIKLLPMMDYVTNILRDDDCLHEKFSASGYASLVRCLGQKFTPQEDRYNNLSDITLKVLWFFYKLASFRDSSAKTALDSLRKIRVLKLYTEVFDYMGAIQASLVKGVPVPTFTDFVSGLRDESRLKKKINWSDRQ